MLKHIQTKVKDWIGKKRPLIDEASAEYKKIVNLQPVPPPRGSSPPALASATCGAGSSRSSVLLRSGRHEEGLRNPHRLLHGALDEASEPQDAGQERVQHVYSVKYQYFDEFSRTCEVWLADNYKNEFHVVDEFRGSRTA